MHALKIIDARPSNSVVDIYGNQEYTFDLPYWSTLALLKKFSLQMVTVGKASVSWLFTDTTVVTGSVKK